MSTQSTTTEIQDEYLLIIDTNCPSYSFSAELCAYVTGQLADDERGIDYQSLDDELESKDWWDSNIKLVESKEGSFDTPCTEELTPSLITVENKITVPAHTPTAEIRRLLIEDVKEKNAETLADASRRLTESDFDENNSKQHCENVLKNINEFICYLEECDEQNLSKSTPKQSVAIHMKRMPSESVIKEAKVRILTFFDELWIGNVPNLGSREKVSVLEIRLAEINREIVTTERIREDVIL